MRVRIRLSPVAQGDILDISDYYAERSPTLAERFIEELILTLHGLTRQPDMGSRRYAHLLPDRSLCMWQLDHFPYLLFYRNKDETLHLLRVLHERRALSRAIIEH
ncbi:type II toxin-antitoxin system RelE/ParE family toxin [Herbaspirillum rubrisubalbicans]|uniref:Type II toxin-antitoxin system RelE/ParE family toxin n=1 Tax=Herbaspirillum rubrisubalbicans TaxID=80842 RepID=A0AAD0U697_9BURK|nr:type II toxin-antitoxin system RelE/ParE family toxin [Herbaspirillum rubrisubalbicans]